MSIRYSHTLIEQNGICYGVHESSAAFNIKVCCETEQCLKKGTSKTRASAAGNGKSSRTIRVIHSVDRSLSSANKKQGFSVLFNFFHRRCLHVLYK